jgi:hypothetical protein
MERRGFRPPQCLFSVECLQLRGQGAICDSFRWYLISPLSQLLDQLCGSELLLWRDVSAELCSKRDLRKQQVM